MVTTCFGATRTVGAWVWDFTPVNLTWSEQTQTFSVRFTIDKGPVDAIKLISWFTMSGVSLTQTVLTVKP